MIHYKEYVRPESLEEAYEKNRKRSAVIAAGNMFLRLGNRSVQTLIDVNSLLPDGIEEREDSFYIGAMTRLRELERPGAFTILTDGAARDCVRHIVGTQFRNCATVGGSIFGRYGFSDVLTCLMPLDACVELYMRGSIPLEVFAREKRDDDILIGLSVKKRNRRTAYESVRREAVDFPVLTVCVSEDEDEKKTYVAVGARPARAELTVYDGLLTESVGMATDKGGTGTSAMAAIPDAAAELASRFTYGSNMRGSREYRQYLAGILIGRAVSRIAVSRECGVQKREGKRDEIAL